METEKMSDLFYSAADFTFYGVLMSSYHECHISTPIYYAINTSSK
jgi:hypothetical protein